MTVPDWAWKVLQLFILPVAIWAVATHVDLKNQELVIDSIKDELSETKEMINKTEEKLVKSDEDLSKTQQDMEILKVRMEYVVEGIDDIKSMLKEQR